MLKMLVVCLLGVCATLSAAPRMVVFDFGGVLTGDPNRQLVVDFLCETFSLSPEQFTEVNREKRRALRLGMTDEEFWVRYAEEQGISLSEGWTDTLCEVMKRAVGVNPNMYLLVEELKASGIPVGLLSNISQRLANFLRDAGLYDPFEPCLLSCELDLEKPDPRIYEVLLERTSLPAQDLLFIDDREENIHGAEAMGIDAILFESEEQLRAELGKRGVGAVVRSTRTAASAVLNALPTTTP